MTCTPETSPRMHKASVCSRTIFISLPYGQLSLRKLRLAIIVYDVVVIPNTCLEATLVFLYFPELT
jgi:hypothetical protein